MKIGDAPRRTRRVTLFALVLLLLAPGAAWAVKGELSFSERVPPFDLGGVEDRGIGDWLHGAKARAGPPRGAGILD